MLSDNKVIEIFYMADDLCKFFNETVEKHSIDDLSLNRFQRENFFSQPCNTQYNTKKWIIQIYFIKML